MVLNERDSQMPFQVNRNKQSEERPRHKLRIAGLLRASSALPVLIAIFVAVGFGQTATPQSPPGRPTESTSVFALEPERVPERELSGGQIHLYRVALATGQFIYTVVHQKGIDVVVAMIGPDGQRLAELDSPNGAYGPEPISWIAESSGIYELEVRAFDGKAPAGKYDVQVVALRSPVQQDRSRFEAQGLRVKAQKLIAEKSEQSIRQAIDTYKRGAQLLSSVPDREQEQQYKSFAIGAYGALANFHFKQQKTKEANAVAEGALQ